MSLLKTLKDKLPKTILVSLAMAGALSFSACTFVKAPVNEVDSDPNTTITDPNGGSTDSNENEQNGSTENEQSGSTENEPTFEEQHSQILLDVINSSYYASLYSKYKTASSIDNELYYHIYSYDVWPIPFGFLSSQGYEIESIKNGELSCTSYPYMLEDEPNSLYIACKAETKASLNYYTCYTLKYTLSDLEVSDLKYLCDKKAAETPLFIQELSYQKTPSVLTKASMSVKAYDSILYRFTNSNDWLTEELFGSTSVTIDVLDFSTENNTLELAVRTDPSNPKQKGMLKYGHLTSGSSTPISSTLINNVNVYTAPYPYVVFQSSEAIEEYKTEYTPITLYAYYIGYVHLLSENL